ncbi:hypothetical protein ACFQZ4_08830 [Catellatospora coxensis]
MYAVVQGAPPGHDTGVTPGDAVGRGLERQVVAGGREQVRAVRGAYHGRVVRAGGAGDPARGGVGRRRDGRRGEGQRRGAGGGLDGGDGGGRGGGGEHGDG